ncbi:hypothetical protein RRG08_058337 [Elysia crispata]|uniref:Uncharacterized protein n=1 Tax=Elysia crispata TaxID=231223 RepID=A0AAE1E9Q2_9GAST|nr:hypothetical protein RRG08_058337 [Elysia crispata]
MSSSNGVESRILLDRDHLTSGMSDESVNNHHQSCDQRHFTSEQTNHRQGHANLDSEPSRELTERWACPYHHNHEGCHGNRKHKVCCIGWRRCENPDFNLDDSALTASGMSTVNSPLCKESLGTAASFCEEPVDVPNSFRYLTVEFSMDLSRRTEKFRDLPSVSSSICSYKQNTLEVEEFLSDYQRCEPKNHVPTSNVTPFFRTHNFCSQGIQKPHHHQSSSLQGFIDCSLVFMEFSKGGWVDLTMSSFFSLRPGVVGAGKACKLFPTVINKALSLSWARTLLVYALVLSILAQTCCEAGLLPRDNKFHLSRGLPDSKRMRQAIPHVQLINDRRRRSPDGGPQTPPAAQSDPSHSNKDRLLNSSNSSSSSESQSPSASEASSSSFFPPLSSSKPPSTVSANTHQVMISPSHHGSPEFIIPDSISQPTLIALLASTLQKLNFIQQGNSSTSRCFRIKKKSTNPLFQEQFLSNKSSLAQDGKEVNFSVEEFYPLPAPVDGNGTSVSSNSSSSAGIDGRDMKENDDDDVVCLNGSFITFNLVPVKTEDVGGKKNSQGKSKSAEDDLLEERGMGKLSRTQIVVISTCSAIIGMFFLIAAFLRIRNYIKRIRLEQALANRPKFRSCSVALRNPTHSMEQLRRDSLASKASHQNSVTTKGSNYSQTNASSREDDSSASSPRHDPDTTPLLIITRAPPGGGADPENPSAVAPIGAGSQIGRGGSNGGPAGSAPHPNMRRLGNVDTPTQSNSSLQYIDEDKAVSKKKAPLTSSLVKNSSGEGGGYTICIKGRSVQAISRSPERPGSLPTGRDVTSTGRGQGRREKSTVDQNSVVRTASGGRVGEGGGGSYSSGGIPDASPTALLSPATSSVDGNVNPSFGSGNLSPAQISDNHEDFVMRTASDQRVAGGNDRPSTSDDGTPRETSPPRGDSPRVIGLPRASSSGKSRAGKYQAVRTEEDKAEWSSEDATHTNTSDGQTDPLLEGQPECSDQCEDLRDPSTQETKRSRHKNICPSDSGEAQDTDFVGPENPCLNDQSCFGLTQSDASVCSASNQGREFSGQREYSPEINDPREGTELGLTQDGLAFPTQNSGSCRDGTVSNSLTDLPKTFKAEDSDTLNRSNACSQAEKEAIFAENTCIRLEIPKNCSYSLIPDASKLDTSNTSDKVECGIDSTQNPDRPTSTDPDTTASNAAELEKGKTCSPDTNNSSCFENHRASPIAASLSISGGEYGTRPSHESSSDDQVSHDQSCETVSERIPSLQSLNASSKSSAKLGPDHQGQPSLLSENNNMNKKGVFSGPNSTKQRPFEKKTFSPIHGTNGTDGELCDDDVVGDCSSKPGKLRDISEKDSPCIDVLSDEKLSDEYR